MRKIAGYLTNSRSEKDKKIAQSTHENGYVKPRRTFWRNSKQLLSQYKQGVHDKMPCRNAGDCITHETTTDDCKSSSAAWGLPESSWGISGAAARHGKVM